jgi:hypothetical protein
MKRNEPGMFLCRALVSLIVVLMIGFLGLGVRAFTTADTTQFIFFAECVISVAILALYFMLRRPSREPTGHSPFREPPFVEPLFLCLCTIGGNPLNLDHLSEKASPDKRERTTPGAISRSLGLRPEVSETARRKRGEGLLSLLGS